MDEEKQVNKSDNLLKEALHLKPQERLLLIDGLIRSLDKPDDEIDAVWADEAQKRLDAYREGKVDGLSFDSVFSDL
mgnify:CR=1 FL=1